jgi:hypothetical protein
MPSHPTRGACLCFHDWTLLLRPLTVLSAAAQAARSSSSCCLSLLSFSPLAFAQSWAFTSSSASMMLARRMSCARHRGRLGVCK